MFTITAKLVQQKQQRRMNDQQKSPIHHRLKPEPFLSITKKRRLSMSNTNTKQGSENGSVNSKNTISGPCKESRKRSSISNVETIETSYNKIEKMREQQKNKWNINTRNIFAFFPTYTTLVDNQTHLKSHLQPQIDYQKQVNAMKDQQYATYCEKGKLAPLRRISRQNSVENQKGNFNMSFFSVEKVSLLPIGNFKYTNQRVKNSLTAAVINNKRALVIPRQSFEQFKKQNEMSKQNGMQLMGEDLLLPPQRELIQIKALTGIKNELSTTKTIRPFVQPFERYYYFDFMWKVAYSNRLQAEFPDSLTRKYRVYIGGGNNSMLIKTLFKRRESWWTITDKIQQANFVWTQIKVNNIFNSQKNSNNITNKQSRLSNDVQKKRNGVQYRRNLKILNEEIVSDWLDYYEKNRDIEQKMHPTFRTRNKYFKTPSKINNANNVENIKIHNHLPQNYVLGNKKALFATMKAFYQQSNCQVFEHIPLTFHIENGVEDKEYSKFLQYFYKQSKQSNKKQQQQGPKQRKRKNIWIVKPGEFTNRGHGITVCHTLEQIKSILKNKRKLDNGNKRTYIVQEYLDKPFLYQKRKFDIRHYMMITSVNGQIKGYWYEQGYIRTTSYQYSTKNNYTSVHLTNDAVQKHLPDYGKYEKGNKISYEQFERYLQKQYRGKYSFFKDIYPQLKKIARDCMQASALLIDDSRKQHNFEIFGFDFMIDSDFHPWLIQINTNPCLELSCPVLMDVIPGMVENALKIGVDSILLPPHNFSEKRARFNTNVVEQNKFQLLYDSTIEQDKLERLFNKGKDGDQQIKFNYKELQKDEQQIYEDDGVELED